MSSKSKVILVGPVPPPYHGSTIYFEMLLRSRIQHEFEVTHVDISDHRGLDNLSRLDFTNVYLAIKNCFDLLRALRQVKPDLVYTMPAATFLAYLRDGLFLVIARTFSKARIVIHLHGGDYFRTVFYEKSNFLVRLFIRWTLSKVDTAIVLGERLKNVFDGLVKTVVAVPNGSNFEASKARKSRTTERKVNISYLGNLLESKGILDFLAAAKIVAETFPNVKFLIAGSWNMHERTKQHAYKIISGNVLESKVSFCGVVTGDQKMQFLADTDIFVFPSWYEYEGCPLVILEAMAAGCPVISTKDVGAIPEIVDDGTTGILVDRKKPRMLAKAILRLLKEPETRIAMGAAGRRKFEQNYTLERNVEKIIEIFNQTLRKI